MGGVNEFLSCSNNLIASILLGTCVLSVYALNFVGCGKLYVADGNWKLRYAHCMWKVPVSIPGFGQINYPSICPLSPKRGHAFCEKHCIKAGQLGYPTELKEFYKHCGVANVDINSGLFVCLFV
jgi:hypothetical protein